MGENTQRRVGLQARKCTARAKSTGKTCGQWAVPGAQTCYFHGAARRDIRAKGDLAAVAAQLGVVGLPPQETVRLVQRALSAQMLRAAGALEAAVAEGRPIDAGDQERFERAADQALVAARVALQAGVEDAREHDHEENAELVTSVLCTAVDGVLAVLSLSHEQNQQVRLYGLALAQWALLGAPPGERPEAPKLPDVVAAPPVVVRGELMPAPLRPRSAPGADDVWRRAQAIIDAEVVDDDQEVGDDESGDPGEAA
jgi:hypothetical protein